MSLHAHLRAAGLLAMLASSSQADTDGVSLIERPDHVTHATVTIDASPQEIYQRVTDYAHWLQYFTDLKSVRVESGGRDHARVWFESRALRHEVLVEFDNVPGRVIRFKGIEGPRGGVASGEYRLIPLEGGTRTEVSADLYLDVTGAAGLFVRDRTTRTMRQAKLQADLGDMERYFASRRATAQRDADTGRPRSM